MGRCQERGLFSGSGFDFAYAARACFDPGRWVRADTRYSYGEDRYQVIGRIEGRLFVVVYTIRSQVMRIIPAPKANSREVQAYEIHTHQD